MRNPLCTPQALALIILITISGAAVAAELLQVDGDGTREHPYEVPNTALPVIIDGVIDDDAWADALVLELKYEVDPGENVAPPVRSEVLIIHDSDTLYAAFRCFDPDPSSIRAHLTMTSRENALIWKDDHVNIHLDTLNGEARNFAIGANAYGVQMDGVADSGGNFDWSWDAVWDSAGQIHDWGYAVELAIPFDQLSLPQTEGPQTWGFNALRVLPRDVVHFVQVVPFDRSNKCLQCQFVKIRGFDQTNAGRT